MKKLKVIITSAKKPLFNLTQNSPKVVGEENRLRLTESIGWSQSLDAVNIYIPHGENPSKLNIEIEPRKLMVGMMDSAPFLQK